MARAGFHRVLARDGSVIELSPDVKLPKSALDEEGRVALVGRHVLRSEDAELAATLAMAFDLGGGALSVRRHGTDDLKRFHRGLVCNGCSRAFLDPVPALFSFNSPRGSARPARAWPRRGIDETA
jgi:excinuclease UvrABC ATPase subunit